MYIHIHIYIYLLNLMHGTYAYIYDTPRPVCCWDFRFRSLAASDGNVAVVETRDSDECPAAGLLFLAGGLLTGVKVGWPSALWEGESQLASTSFRLSNLACDATTCLGSSRFRGAVGREGRVLCP